uniref:Apple domain-containing protein n=1 Tax=Toxocara canis TaxID=6265 RepID=A0A183V0Y4_TOXCA
LCSAFASLLDCYNFYAGYYLLRSGNVIIPHVESVDSCLQKCANAEELYGFICRSVMVENKRNNCVLSKWDRLSRPDRFMRSNKFHINYYERICDLEQVCN